jgi:hypothetical protein
MTYEFANTLHRNSRELHDHIAESYLFASGHNSNDDVAEILAETGDWGLMRDAEANWFLDDPDSGVKGYDRTDMLAAFDRFRKAFNVTV